MNNAEIARRFYRLSALMEIRGDDPFRLRSYRNAAEAIEVWPTPLKEIAEKEGLAGLQEIPGVGKAIGRATADAIRPGGAFLVYQFSPKVLDFIKPWFERIDRGFEWINVPPATLFWAWRKPKED